MSDISAFLSGKGIRLNKDLGQHFLVDEEILQKIVETADIQPDDSVVEIGAGVGVLTKELVKKAGKVTAIELDKSLIPLLKEYTTSKPITSNLDVVQGNALEIPFPNTPYKVVANIPYHITSPLLRHAFLESEVNPTTMTLLIQKEVAQKICPPGCGRTGDTKDHGLLTILVGLFGKPEIIANVPPEAFLPPPKVQSAVLHIECFTEPLADEKTVDEIFRLTKLAFSKKRKMLRNTIGEMEGGMKLLERVGIDPTRRPQTVSVEEWIKLAS